MRRIPGPVPLMCKRLNCGFGAPMLVVPTSWPELDGTAGTVVIGGGMLRSIDLAGAAW